MTERIGIRLTELIAPIIPVNLSEAETARYPFAVYEYEPTPVYTKDGIYKISSEVTVIVVSDDFDTAQVKADAIDAALTGIGEGFTYRLDSQRPDCQEGIWTITMTIQINQYN